MSEPDGMTPVCGDCAIEALRQDVACMAMRGYVARIGRDVIEVFRPDRSRWLLIRRTEQRADIWQQARAMLAPLVRQ